MKLNKTMLGEIASRVIKATIAKNIETKKESMDKIGDAILKRIFEHDGTSDFMKSVPDDYFENARSFYIGIVKQEEFVELGSVFGISGKNEGKGISSLEILCSYQKIPQYMRWRATRYISENDANIVAYKEMKSQLEDLKKQESKAKIELPHMLAQFKTAENLIKELPDMQQYIPEECLLPPTKALAIRAEEIAGYINDLAA